VERNAQKKYPHHGNEQAGKFFSEKGQADMKIKEGMSKRRAGEAGALKCQDDGSGESFTPAAQ